MEGREEEDEKNKKRKKLVFAINGERFEVSKIDPSTTVLEFLRTQTRYTGTKLSCGEGGCGACVVLLSKYDPVLEKVEDFTVSSCLTLLCSINGCSITTTEGLGNSKDGFHPIHKRISGFHASQCGFCTPGMCMSLFSALVNAEKTQKDNPPPGFSKLTVSEAEKAISGNLCRCTGYRPIADTCKSFAADADMEDLGLNSFWKWGENVKEKVSKLPLYTPHNEICTFPEFLKRELKSKSLLDSKKHCWYSPVTVEELKGLMESIESENSTAVKLVVGNTGTGYYKELGHYNKYIDLRHIPELSMIRSDCSVIEIGAAVTISNAILALKEERKGGYNSTGNLVFRKISDHMNKVASEFIRNTASLGGNLVMAQRNQFPSDIATILLAAGSSLDILSGSKRLKLTLEEFLESPCDIKTVLVSIRIPSWDPVKSFSSQNGSGLMFETYRAAPRPLGNALAYLNAAFLAEVSTSKTSGCIVLEKLQLAFGAYGTKHAIRARKVEELLIGRSLSRVVLFDAIKLLRATIIPEADTSSPAYRSSLAVGFLFDFLHPLTEVSTAIPSDGLMGDINTSALMASKANNEFDYCSHIKRPGLLSSGKQVVEVSREFHPVGEPTKKAGAEIQASGEAVYVDDIPSPKDCLHGAFIYSKRPLAWIKNIELVSPSPSAVVRVISVEDIPKGGENVGSKTMFGSEILFADQLTQYAGQILGFVVADTQKHADMAADCAVVEYDTGNLEPPILSVEEAVDRSSFFEVPSFLFPKQVGDFSKGMGEADHKILSAEIKLGSQYYFYMETQTALAVPDEDNCMVVYSSSQCPENAQIVIARCLGLPEHNVRVITRRVGGGFGGKALKAMPVATACAVAAHKLRRPVRVYLSRKTDMIMAGGRHPMKIKYSVGFKSDGKITVLHLDILINAGISEDISPIMPNNMLGALKKYNWGALSFDIKVCKTNLSSKSAMRAPGEVQASFIAEAVVEHVASFLSMEVDSVRKRNIHTYESLKLFYQGSAGEPLEYTLPLVLDKLAKSSSFHQRVEVIKQFNSCNKWRKRGISRVPIFHEVMLRPTPGKVSILNDGSVVVEVGGIELGQGLWTKVKQMAAFALSPVECDGSADLLERVRVIQADTLSLVQGGFTAGSTTSESSCEAVRLCCNTLVERLTILKERLQEQMGAVSWDTLIVQAHLQSVNLSASDYYVPEFSSMRYLNYGAAVSEVEIDLLTGATTILQTDIVYDCGQSLNPAVDLGQIEGAFVQGVGFFMLEEYLTNSDGLVVSEGTWTYKIPTIDTIPRQFNVEILNSGHHQKRVLSSKASGEPPLLLAASVHCATRDAIKEARKQVLSWSRSVLDASSYSTFQLDVPATMPVVKELCGLDNVDRVTRVGDRHDPQKKLKKLQCSTTNSLLDNNASPSYYELVN
ncbi:Aldehyde oxidase/xanthine dehydrogenase [Macleaya cordata]|uniref:Aldehyde oxidase/xanthine dehydrogenase n=1 Tax=Macleaya cordata TaxID=56857 RepID=A0A200PRM1_MACCD|nr:Aldehyde oxidase/xanthine dehydrogenase [Macleaya cordata]